MDRAVITSAINAKQLNAARLLAYSIKIRHPNLQVNLMTNEKFENDIFDNVFELPFGQLFTVRENDYQLYWASPVESNLFIDCFSVVKRELESIFEYCEDHHDICISNFRVDYKGLPFIDKTKFYFNEYDLSKVNSAIFYWKKDADEALRYFKMADPIMQDWRNSYPGFINKKHMPNEYDSDLAHACVLSALGNREDILPIFPEVLKTVDMKMPVQYFNKAEDGWLNYLNTWVTSDSKLKIQNYAMKDIVNYHEADFVTQDMLDKHGNYYRHISS